MALSGFINPYPGRLGVVESGALADLLLVDGNPLDNFQLVADPDKSFLVIMKKACAKITVLANVTTIERTKRCPLSLPRCLMFAVIGKNNATLAARRLH